MKVPRGAKIVAQWRRRKDAPEPKPGCVAVGVFTVYSHEKQGYFHKTVWQDDSGDWIEALTAGEYRRMSSQFDANPYYDRSVI